MAITIYPDRGVRVRGHRRKLVVSAPAGSDARNKRPASTTEDQHPTDRRRRDRRQECKGQGDSVARRLIDARYTGRAFQPQAVRTEMLAVTRDVELAAADYGLWRVKAYNAHDFQHPTGAYRSRLHVEKRSMHPIVTDGGVIYGPWLEGVGSRNQTTRFKGYHHFRRATQDVQRNISRIADKAMKAALRRLN